MQEKGNIDLAIRYYLIAIEVCMQFWTCKCSFSFVLFWFSFLSFCIITLKYGISVFP